MIAAGPRSPWARRALVVLALALPAAGCAHKGARGPAQAPVPPAPDSAAIAVWHMDENGGIAVWDSGPYRLQGTAGVDTRTDFGRFRASRVFQRANDSFVFVPYNPALESPGPFTVEAWINVTSIGTYELQVIAARWTPVPNQRSWVLGVTGRNYPFPIVPVASPGWFASVRGDAPAQRLVFAYVPAGAGAERGYVSTTDLPLGRWVHVAASIDGDVVGLYVDGRLDAQYLNRSFIRSSPAPLLIGTALDPRHLTSFGGDLRVDPSASVTPYYQFDGQVDELRLSRCARSRFESVPGR